MVADCRLSVEVSPGVYEVYSEEAKKLFRLGKFVMAGYSGSRRSARFALEKLRRAVPQQSMVSANTSAVEDHLRRLLHKGAIEARTRARSRGELAQCGPFCVFVAYLDSGGHFINLAHIERGKNPVYYAGIPDETGKPRIFVMGSGMVAALDYRESLTRIIHDFTRSDDLSATPFIQLAGATGLALLDVLQLKKAPFSGGGIQAMSLTGGGVQALAVSQHFTGIPD